MQNLSAVAEVESSEQLEHEHFDVVRVQRSGMLLHVVAEICVLVGAKHGESECGPVPAVLVLDFSSTCILSMIFTSHNQPG